MISGIPLASDLPRLTVRRSPRLLDVTVSDNRPKRHKRPRKSQRKFNSRSN